MEREAKKPSEMVDRRENEASSDQMKADGREIDRASSPFRASFQKNLANQTSSQKTSLSRSAHMCFIYRSAFNSTPVLPPCFSEKAITSFLILREEQKRQPSKAWIRHSHWASKTQNRRGSGRFRRGQHAHQLRWSPICRGKGYGC